jgi:L-ascorbate metabolism protein UlaG (beta-lactamase superfamily)
MTTDRLTATFVGGPTLAFRYGGLGFLTDPTFDEPGEYDGGIPLHKLVGPSVRVDDLGPIDVVLLSHDQHADNLDHAGRALLADVPLVLSTPDAAARVPGVRGLPSWERVELAGDVVVTAVPARHGPEGAEPLSGAVTGFVLEGPGLPTVYVAGDNASLDVVDSVARRFPAIDVAVLFVGGANVGRFGDEPVTLDAARASAAADLMAGATIVPVHHTDWAHFVDPLSAVVERFAAGGRADRLVVLERGVPTVVQPLRDPVDATG